jgi:uncharacterized membrane protein YqiK
MELLGAMTAVAMFIGFTVLCLVTGIVTVILGGAIYEIARSIVTRVRKAGKPDE